MSSKLSLDEMWVAWASVQGLDANGDVAYHYAKAGWDAALRSQAALAASGTHTFEDIRPGDRVRDFRGYVHTVGTMFFTENGKGSTRFELESRAVYLTDAERLALFDAAEALEEPGEMEITNLIRGILERSK